MEDTDPNIIKSSYLYNLNDMKVDYETVVGGGFGGATALAEFKKRMASIGLKLTFYDRLPKRQASGDDSQLFKLIDVKFVDQLKQSNGGTLYFFAYKGYEAKLESYRKMLTKTFKQLKWRPEFRVRYLACVSVGGLFAFENDQQFVRVRVIALNRSSKQVKFWAVDEGYFGDCQPEKLYFLNDFCVSLDMLAVPGVIEGNLNQRKKRKISEGEMCKTLVEEPILHDDAGPRKIMLVD